MRLVGVPGFWLVHEPGLPRPDPGLSTAALAAAAVAAPVGVPGPPVPEPGLVSVTPVVGLTGSGEAGSSARAAGETLGALRCG